uniref:Major facilitator superfamily (MFS) profile domain-containing protein n=1 Tax=Zooxanthella nutricula TaxID=1333877 RepID=A0A6U6UMQ0_9DINO
MAPADVPDSARVPLATHPRPRLTTKTLFVLGSMNMIDCINANLLTPYVVQMVSDFMHTSPKDPQVGHVVAILVGLYSVCEVCFSVFWGAIADRLGRKPALLIGLAGSVIAPIMFGLGKSLTVVFVARFLDGFFCGNVGVSRTYLGEIVDSSNETQAFGFLAVCFSFGLFIGPILGGQLVYPASFAPSLFGGTIFDTYPYLLPNLTYAVFALVAWVIGAIFLEETLPEDQRRGCCRFRERRVLQRQLSNSWTGTDPSGAPHSSPMSAEERGTVETARRCYPRTLLQVILAYCALAGTTAASTQLFVLITSYPSSEGGFGFGPKQIGFLQNFAAVGLLLTQLFIYPRACKRFGFYRIFMLGWAIFVVSCAMFPVCGIFADAERYGEVPRFAALGISQFFSAMGAGFCFPTAFAFINRASSGLDKGVANGWANSCGAMCRGLWPPIFAWLLGILARSDIPDGGYNAVHINLIVGTVAIVAAMPGLRAADRMATNARKPSVPPRAAAPASSGVADAATDAAGGLRAGAEPLVGG